MSGAGASAAREHTWTFPWVRQESACRRRAPHHVDLDDSPPQERIGVHERVGRNDARITDHHREKAEPGTIHARPSLPSRGVARRRPISGHSLRAAHPPSTPTLPFLQPQQRHPGAAPHQCPGHFGLETRAAVRSRPSYGRPRDSQRAWHLHTADQAGARTRDAPGTAGGAPAANRAGMTTARECVPGPQQVRYAEYGLTMVWCRWAMATTFRGNRGPAT